MLFILSAYSSWASSINYSLHYIFAAEAPLIIMRSLPYFECLAMLLVFYDMVHVSRSDPSATLLHAIEENCITHYIYNLHYSCPLADRNDSDDDSRGYQGRQLRF